MAQRPFEPVPNTPLVANPTGDAIWKRWLQNLQAFLGSAVRGPGSSTDNAVARWNGTTGTFLNNSGVIIDDSNNVSGVVNLTTTGNVQLGDASGDTLTINAGTWTYGANWTATRAAGTVATGTQNLLSQVTTVTGDAGGGTDVRGFRATIESQGANAFAVVQAFLSSLTHAGSATVTTSRSNFSPTIVSSTGSITNARGFESVFTLSSSGNVTTADGFLAGSPTLSSTGAITTITGFRAANLGHASLVTNAIGFDQTDFTGSVTLTAGFRSQMTSGTGKWGFLHSGTANNAFNGNVRIGSTTAPTVALDVTGDALISGSITSSALTSGRVPLVSTSGLLVDSSKFTYTDTSQVIAYLISGSASIGTIYYCENTHATGDSYMQTTTGNGSAGDSYFWSTKYNVSGALGFASGLVNSSGSWVVRKISAGTKSTVQLELTSTGSFITNATGSALATNATNGFTYIPTCAGTPTGAPTAVTGAAPMVIDSTNNKLYFYSGGAWRDAGP